MSDCPDVSVLESRRDWPDVIEHAAGCPACRAVLVILDDRRRGAAAQSPEADCAKFEALMALRADVGLEPVDARLLQAHLEGCQTCRAVADTLAPGTETSENDHTGLPEVSPDAYALGREIARGGMGRILAARDLRIGRSVAVKELLGHAAGFAARFEREARVTSRLQHPGIIPIYEIGRWPDGKPFYSMRNVPGRNLHEAIAAAHSLGERLALLPAVIAATEAVAYAHGKGVIHRDLTPSNILVGAYGETVVIDWGLAKDLASLLASAKLDGDAHAKDADPGGLTAAGTVLGTAAYMPPEQARGEAVDERADVYALGAILYHLLTGRAAYGGASSEEILRQLRQTVPPSISEIEIGAPADLVSIVEKAMARRAGDRYPSARELAEELSRFQTGRLVQAHEYSRRELVRRWLRRNRAAVVTTLAALAVLAAGGVLGITRTVHERDRARATAMALLEEQGRQELLAGNSLRALPYLSAAYEQGNHGAPLRYLVAAAMRDVDRLERTLPGIGAQLLALEFSPDGARVLVVRAPVIEVWDVASGARLLVLQTPDYADFKGALYSRDGSRILGWGDDASVRLWDARTGALLRSLRHDARVTSAGFTADGTRVVTTSFDRTSRVWDAATGRLVRTIQAIEPPALGVRGVLHADGSLLATLGHEGQAKVWDISAETLLSTFDHGAHLTSGAFSPEGRRLVTCGDDGKAKVWEVAGGRQLVVLSGHTSLVWTCAFSADGRTILTSSADGTARVWDAASGAELTAVSHGALFAARATFSPEGSTFVTAASSGIRVWSADGGALLSSHEGGSDPVAVFSPDGARLATGAGGNVSIWDARPGRLRFALRPALPEGSTVEDVSPDGTRVVTCTANGDGTLWDATTQQALPHSPFARPAAFSADGRRLAVATPGKGSAILDSRSGAVLASIPEPSAPLTRVELDAGGERLLTVTEKDAPRVWDVASGRLLVALDGMTGAGALSPDGRTLVGWSQGRRGVWVWDVERRGPTGTVDLGFDTIAPIAVTKGGARVALAISEGVEKLSRVDLIDLHPARRLVSAASALSAALDGDGKRMAVFGSGIDVRIWDVEDERATDLPIDRADPIVVGALGSDGSLGASGRHAGAELWSARDGRVLARFPQRSRSATLTGPQDWEVDSIEWPRFTPDGTSLVVISLRHGVKVWDVRLEARPPEAIARIVRDRVPWRLVQGRLVRVTGAIHGLVQRDGRPLARAVVTATAYSGTQYRATTDTDGAFELAGMEPGSYDVEATSEAGDTFARHRDVAVAKDDTTALILSTNPGGAISGVVVDGDGQPVPEVYVNFRCPGTGEVCIGRGAGDGSFTARPLLGGCEYTAHVSRRVPYAEVLTPLDGAFPKTYLEKAPAHLTGVRLVVLRPR